MGTINLRIDDELKAASFAELEKLGVTPSDLLRQTLEYVAVNKKLPFTKAYLSNDEDILVLTSPHCCEGQGVWVLLTLDTPLGPAVPLYGE